MSNPRHRHIPARKLLDYYVAAMNCPDNEAEVESAQDEILSRMMAARPDLEKRRRKDNLFTLTAPSTS